MRAIVGGFAAEIQLNEPGWRGGRRGVRAGLTKLDEFLANALIERGRK